MPYRCLSLVGCALLFFICGLSLVAGNPPAARAGALGGYFGGTDSQADKPAAPQTAPQAAPQASPQAAPQAAPQTATATACRQMLIHLSDYYGPVQRVKLNQVAGDIKQIYWFKQQNAQRLRIIYRNNQRQEVRLMSNPHSIRGLSFWCQGNQQCPKVPGLENQEFVLNFMAHFNNQPTHLACSTYKRGGYPGKVLFNNFNGNGVQNNPTRKTVFRLNGRCAITEVHTFHHNQYQGRAPGKIFIKGVNGTRGSWAFKARPGLSSWPNYYLPNCNWIVNPPNLTLGPGTYEITVSDPASWSHNRGSGNAGYAIVWGRCSAAPRPTTTTTLPPSTTTTLPPTPGNTLPPSTTTTQPPIPGNTLPPTTTTTQPPIPGNTQPPTTTTTPPPISGNTLPPTTTTTLPPIPSITLPPTPTTTLPPSPATTSDSWVSWRGHRYLVVATKVTWHEAHDQAKMMGGHLVVISDKAENEFVTNLAHAKGAGPIYWMGCTDLGSEGNWRWENGQKITYNNWSVNEPNNFQNREHCGNVGWRSKYGWDDAPCSERHGFVVEMDSQAAPPPAASKPTFIGQWHGWTQCTDPANGKKPFNFTVSKSGQSYVCDDHSGQNKFKPGYLTQSGQTTWLVCPWARSQSQRGVYYWRMDSQDPKLLHGREDVQGLTCKSYNYLVRKVK